MADDVPSVNPYAFIQHPRITSIRRQDIQEFLAQRDSYEAAVSSQQGLSPVPYANCFDPIFLKSLVQAQVFGAAIKEVSSLTDAIIKTTLTSLSSRGKIVDYEEVMADVKRSISLDASEPDPRLRIIILQTAYLDLCNHRGWNFVEKAPKAAVKHILSVIQPPELKNRLHNALKLEQSDLEEDFFGFCTFLQEQSEICEQFYPLRKYRSNPKPTIARKSKKSSDGSGSSTPKVVMTGRVLPPCLNPRCKKNHFVKDCEITSSAEAKQLLDARRNGIKKFKTESKVGSSSEKKDLKKDTSRTQASSSTGKSTSKPAVVMAELSGYKFACRIDSGADEVAVSDTIIQFLGDQEISLPTIHLRTPKTFKAVDGHIFKSPGTVKICPTIKTVAGPCCLRNVKAYIMPCTDTNVIPGADCAGEIVLGNPFLVHSGLDVTDFIANNIDHLSKIDYGALNSVKHQETLGELGVRLLTEPEPETEIDITQVPPRICNIVADGDFPLKDGDEIDYKDLEIGDQDQAELDEAIHLSIDRASENLSEEAKFLLRKWF